MGKVLKLCNDLTRLYATTGLYKESKYFQTYSARSLVTPETPHDFPRSSHRTSRGIPAGFSHALWGLSVDSQPRLLAVEFGPPLFRHVLAIYFILYL